jgi:hypothetical protein
MHPRLPRRRFLQVAGAAAVLAACGDAADSGAGSTADAETGPSVPVALFSTDRVLAAGSEQRIPFAVFDGFQGVPRRDEGLPRSLDVEVRVRDGDTLGTYTVPLHGLELAYPYYPLRTTLPEPGLYELAFALDDGPARLTIQAFDPAEVRLVQPGQAMPGVATATADAPLDVDPLCTRFEPCAFHTASLDEALAAGPVALLVGTPAYCQTGICGPVLESLIDVAPAYPGITIIHAEVYENPREVGGNLADPAIRTAAITEQLGLTFEPALFCVDRTGTVTDRLDNVYDSVELRAALDRIA